MLYEIDHPIFPFGAGTPGWDGKYFFTTVDIASIIEQ
jgi:hypothetical protein